MMMMMNYLVSMRSPPPGAACLHDVRAATTSDNAAMARVLEGRICFESEDSFMLAGAWQFTLPSNVHQELLWRWSAVAE